MYIRQLLAILINNIRLLTYKANIQIIYNPVLCEAAVFRPKHVCFTIQNVVRKLQEKRVSIWPGYL